MQLYRGTPMSRITTLVIMMGIMALIFVRLRDPSTWRWFARDQADETQVIGDDDLSVAKPPPKTHSGAVLALATSATVPSAASSSATSPAAAAASQKAADSGKAVAAAPLPAVPAAGPLPGPAVPNAK